MTKTEAGAPARAVPARSVVLRDRVIAIDIARFFGIVLVYYGHIVEQAMYRGNAAAALQYKFIYSFHMPLFFVLSGMIAKDWGQLYSPATFLKTRIASRVVPLLVFNLLLALVSLGLKPSFPPIPLATSADYGQAILTTLTRLPLFDIPTWFLMCLVSVEIIHAVVYRSLRSDIVAAAAVAVFLVAGYALNAHEDFFAAKTNIWFWNEAVTMYAFYLAGVLVARWGLLHAAMPKVVAAVAGIVALAVVLATFDLNDGPFRLKIPAVVILFGAHGQIGWFVLTAAVGSAAVVFLALWAAPTRWLGYLGRNALVLFCLNGVFYHHVNAPVTQWFAQNWPQSGPWLFVFAAGFAVASLALAMPIVVALDRYLPQLVGRPAVAGPWLPALVHLDQRQVSMTSVAGNAVEVR